MTLERICLVRKPKSAPIIMLRRPHQDPDLPATRGCDDPDVSRLHVAVVSIWGFLLTWHGLWFSNRTVASIRVLIFFNGILEALLVDCYGSTSTSTQRQQPIVQVSYSHFSLDSYSLISSIYSIVASPQNMLELSLKQMGTSASTHRNMTSWSTASPPSPYNACKALRVT